MAKKQRKQRKSRPLVLGYLERVSSKVFSDFPKELTDLVGRKHGVYALYKGDRLYYVGLSGKLRGRIKHHLRDRHSGKWDKFSLYLVRKADHIKELESMILRIADPTGNLTRGRLPRAENLSTELDSKVKRKQDEQRRRIFEQKRRRQDRPPSRKPKSLSGRGRQPALASHIENRFKIRAKRKGRTYDARVRSDGTINFNGAIYNSPSTAGRAAIGRATNGWHFWRFKNKRGEWVKLDELRKKR